MTDPAREYFDERAAIAEYDGGLSRDEAEQQAVGGLIGVPELSRDEKMRLLANYMAVMESNERRAGFVAQLRKHHGDAVADEVRSLAWAEIQRREMVE